MRSAPPSWSSWSRTRSPSTAIEKVVPDEEDLAAAWRAAKAHADIAAAVEQANAEAAERWADAEAPDDLADQVREILADDPTASWDEALRRIARAAP